MSGSTTRESRGRAAMNDNDNNASMDETARNNASLPELPFLVTHWLHNYQGPEAGGGNREREEAIDRLRNATSEMAAAFSSLGAYGASSRVCCTRDDYIFSLEFSSQDYLPFPFYILSRRFDRWTRKLHAMPRLVI